MFITISYLSPFKRIIIQGERTPQLLRLRAIQIFMIIFHPPQFKRITILSERIPQLLKPVMIRKYSYTFYKFAATASYERTRKLSINRTAEGIPGAELDLIMLWIAAEC